MAIDLIDDAEMVAQYERHHAGGVPPEVIDDIRSSGVQALEIWRVETRCFMILEVSPDYPRARAVTPDPVKQWDALMSRFQVPLASAEPAQGWAPLRRVYRLPDERG